MTSPSPRRLLITSLTLFLTATTMLACGDGETLVNLNPKGAHDQGRDQEDPRDLGTPRQDQPLDQPDLGVDLNEMDGGGSTLIDAGADMRALDQGQPPADMSIEEPDMGTIVVVPPSDPVQTFERSSCTTESVKGLSQQLIDEMNCISPGLMESIGGISNLSLYSAVFPYLQRSAAQGLRQVAQGQGTLNISSALRTVPQQYLLYRWYQLGRCNIGLAAKPGASNHNGGLAVDTPDYNAWRTRFTSMGWRWLGSSDPVHFDHAGEDVRATSVRAFQRLWNRNNAQDTIAEDGDYGPQTEARLKQSPSGGFMRGPSCRVNALVNPADIGASVDGQLDASGQLERVIVIAPSAVRWIEVWSHAQIVEALGRDDGAGPNFDMVRPAWAAQPGLFELRAYDAEGRLLDRATFAPKLPTQPHRALWAEGFGRYRLSEGSRTLEHLRADLGEEDPMTIWPAILERQPLLAPRAPSALTAPRLPLLGH